MSLKDISGYRLTKLDSDIGPDEETEKPIRTVADIIRETPDYVRLESVARKWKNASIALVVVFAMSISGLGFLLYEETGETAELKEELRSTESQLQVVLADYYELEASAGNIEELEAENKTLSAEVSNLEHQVDTQTVEIASLKAALEEAQSKPASSGPGSSTGSSSGGTTSSTSDTQSVTVYITNTGSKYHKNQNNTQYAFFHKSPSLEYERK